LPVFWTVQDSSYSFASFLDSVSGKVDHSELKYTFFYVQDSIDSFASFLDSVSGKEDHSELKYAVLCAGQ
jgi:hypothetical protein